jgi:hypothetical protein
MRLIASFQIAQWPQASTGMSAFELGIDAVEEVQVELGGDPGRIVIAWRRTSAS